MSLGTASGRPEGQRRLLALGVGREQLGASGATHPEPYLLPTQAGHPAAPALLPALIQDLGIGTFRDLAVVLETAPILTAGHLCGPARVCTAGDQRSWYLHPGWGLGWGGAVGSQGLCGLSLGPRMESGLESLPALSLDHLACSARHQVLALKISCKLLQS